MNVPKRSRKALALEKDRKRRRRKREGLIILALMVVVALLTLIEARTIRFGGDIPISNTILMFILININLLLLLLLIFLVLRNLVKLLYERKRRVMGAKLSTRLVVAFIGLSLLPTTVLFLFSISFITTSIEFWFNVPVEHALNHSLSIGRHYYRHLEQNNAFTLQQIAHQIQSRKLMAPDRRKALERYVQVVQRSFNLNALEVYQDNAQRVTVSQAPNAGDVPGMLSANQLRLISPAHKVRTISEQVAGGELYRTIGTIPFGSSHADAGGYVVINDMIPAAVADGLASITTGYEEYQQIKLLKQPIKITYFITLSIVALLVVFSAVWFGFHFAKSISIPIKDLAEGTRKVAEGDLNFRIGAVADDEIGSLVESFNKMTRDLRISRDQLELSARKLSEQNAEIEEKRQYMEIVLKNVSAGVITLDAGGFITTINTSAEKMLNLKGDEIMRKNYKALLKDPRLADIGTEVIESLAKPHKSAIELPVRITVDGRPHSFLLHVNALRDDTGRQMGVVMVFDDLTDLEKAQRMAAWREVARRIAHEVKNPLTPITLSAQRLKRKYADQIKESVFTECTQTIIDHVELIRNLVNEFSTFARFPTANPSQCELPPIIDETVALYREGHPDINFEIQMKEYIPPLKLDRQQIKQALINLVDNAVAAIKAIGSVIITVSHDPILKMVRIEVIDTGCGIADKDKTHLFEPYFSTKKAGMGLGLTIVSTIVADHNGMLRVLDNQPQGARFIIELPMTPDGPVVL